MKKMTKREKMLLGLSVVSAGVAGYLGIKYMKTNRRLIEAVAKNKDLGDVTQNLELKVTTLMEAASEGVFEEAISTVNNKINYRIDRKKYLLEHLLQAPDDIQTKAALEKVENELTNLLKRKDKFTEAQTFYVIKDIAE